MAETSDPLPGDDPDGRPTMADAAAPRRSRAGLWLGGAALVVLAGLGAVWLSRDRLADRLISDQLAARGIAARYRIESIGADRQVLRDVVIGDPSRPDLVVARLESALGWSWTGPTLRTVRLDGVRLAGNVRGGKASFGALDPLLFPKTASTAPFALPALDVALNDAQARLETDYGSVALRLQGRGRLDDGFAGTLKAAAPRLIAAGCTVAEAGFAGSLATAGGLPRLAGPLTAAGIDCGKGTQIAAIRTMLSARADKDFKGLTADLALTTGAFALPAARGDALAANGDVALRGSAATARFAGTASAVDAGSVRLAQAGFDGTLTSRGNRLEAQGNLAGRDLAAGTPVLAALGQAANGARGTLPEPYVAAIRSTLLRESRGSRLAARFDLRRSGGATTLNLPEARLTGGSGANLLALSRASLVLGGHAMRIGGNLITSGAGLPHLTGRFDSVGGGESRLQLAMAEWREGTSRLALPRLTATLRADGRLAFAGSLLSSGAIPGGRVDGLVLPVSGTLAANGTLSLLDGCTPTRFDRLALGEMVLDARSLVLCPPAGRSILRQNAAGLAVAAGVPALDLTGRFGGSPLRLSTGPVGLAWPGALSAKGVKLALGQADKPTRLTLDRLEATLGRDLAGRFDGLAAGLAGVPLDVAAGSGRWRYAAGGLKLTDAAFAVTDREATSRFEKLVARGATLTLARGTIAAEALLREPVSDKPVARALILHDLSNARGHADLVVDDLRFDPAFQPTALTRLSKGLVANVAGTVRGRGRIDWSGDKVSSSGTFTTDNLDLAAAFGPVKGISGSVRFTDLLGMVTAPGQTLRIAAINPGIEVADGVLRFALLPDSVLNIEGAQWPFEGGTLRLEPTELRFGNGQVRRFVLAVEALDAAKFVEHLELGNLSATGLFDGELPLVFDDTSGKIVGGRLVSRPPGGNIAYVGALSYKDLSAMANFAFDALKSLDYQHMTIDMNGELEGEIITTARFDGVKQGEGTKRNFATRAVARLPLQFNVNIRAPFFALITNVKRMSDPTFVSDPRTLGLVDEKGRPLPGKAGGTPATVVPPPPAPALRRTN